MSFCIFSLQLLVPYSFEFCLCSEEEDLASPPRALTASPGRVATPLAVDTTLQPEVAPTVPVASTEKAVVMPDAAASTSRPTSWEEHVSHPLRFHVTILLYAYSAHCILLVMLWSRQAKPLLGWSKRRMRSAASLSSKPVSIATRSPEYYEMLCCLFLVLTSDSFWFS